MTDEVERRLRSALAARAGQITPDRLRFGTPPTVAVPRRSFTVPLRRWLPVLAAGVVAVVLLSFALRPDDPEPQPILPAGPPSATAAVPEPSPPGGPGTSPIPTASPVRPSAPTPSALTPSTPTPGPSESFPSSTASPDPSAVSPAASPVS